jgi:macrolide-specific efflux system membrane fusion protein
MRVEEANLKYAKIYAPMAGTVISVAARQGQTLNANQSAPTILRIADLSTMTVQTQVSEADVGKLRVGMPSYFTTLGSAGRRFTGTLRKIEPTPTVTNNVVLYNALFDVPNSGNVLLPQMTAQVFFIAAEAHDVLMVPVAALTMQRAQRSAPAAAAAAEPVDGEVVRTEVDRNAAPANAQQAAAPGSDRAAQSNWRRNRAANSPAMPRNATVKVAQSDGNIVERAVTVGVSNRVNAQILSGLNEGEKVVVGQKLPDAPKNQQQQQQRPLGAAGGIGGGGTGPGRR